MSAKWERSKQWDREHLTGPWLPLKWTVRVFSEIPTAVLLLTFVLVYAILASVPIGLLVRLVSYLFYGATLLLAIAVVAVAPMVLSVVTTKKSRASWGRTARFLSVFVPSIVLTLVATWLWWHFAWPRLHYDPSTKSGVMFFADFIRRYEATPLRRLPGVEMSELEFYGWWPLRLALLLFVVNLVVATIRRIEFDFKHLGVLTVHTGIVLIALGSIYYHGLKKEGDTVLFAGTPDAEGRPTVGPAQDRFYDNTRVALYLSQGRQYEQRPLTDIPRYNDYGLDLAPGEVGAKTALSAARRKLPWAGTETRTISIPVMQSMTDRIDRDLQFRIVGYASYAEPLEDWVPVGPGKPGDPVIPGQKTNPLRIVNMRSQLPGADGKVPDGPVMAYTLLPAAPAQRISANAEIGLEYTLGPDAGMPAERWAALSLAVPPETLHALVIEVPGKDGAPDFRGIYPVKPGDQLAVGATGFKVEVRDLLPQPPFPIITPGYQGATSSVAIVHVSPPNSGPGFDRYVYHRFPGINQDMLEEKNDRGMPKRRDADPAIRIWYLDCSPLIQAYIDEPSPEVPSTRALVRFRGGNIKVFDQLEAGDTLPLVPKLSIQVAERWQNATRIERPAPVPTGQQDKSRVGTHENGMLAVEITSPEKLAGFRTIVWLPFTRYMGAGIDAERHVHLPDGREINLMFGRLTHRFPDFVVQLADFQMLSYDHRGAPRDYQSVLRVSPVVGVGAKPPFDAYEHVTKLNAPLTAPWVWNEQRAWITNVMSRLASGINPNQFKLSQSGWDQQGWAQSQKLVDQGLAKRPHASFTILGVGNNPGIHVIAFGGFLMAIGTPWAFYIKPWLVQREKRAIQRQLAAGTYKRPKAPRPEQPEPVGVS